MQIQKLLFLQVNPVWSLRHCRPHSRANNQASDPAPFPASSQVHSHPRFRLNNPHHYHQCNLAHSLAISRVLFRQFCQRHGRQCNHPYNHQHNQPRFHLLQCHQIVQVLRHLKNPLTILPKNLHLPPPAIHRFPLPSIQVPSLQPARHLTNLLKNLHQPPPSHQHKPHHSYQVSRPH